MAGEAAYEAVGGGGGCGEVVPAVGRAEPVLDTGTTGELVGPGSTAAVVRPNGDRAGFRAAVRQLEPDQVVRRCVPQGDLGVGVARGGGGTTVAGEPTYESVRPVDRQVVGACRRTGCPIVRRRSPGADCVAPRPVGAEGVGRHVEVRAGGPDVGEVDPELVAGDP